MDPLLPTRHPNHDLFICDVLNAIPKDDVGSMEHPIFSLATAPDRRRLRYEHNGCTVEIIPSILGLPTIHDKDVLIYVISQLIAKINQGDRPDKQVMVTAHQLLIATNRPTNNLGYARLRSALDRLVGTRIKTNIKTGGVREIDNFGLIERYRIIEKSPIDGRMVGIIIILSDWLYNAVCAREVLTLHHDYFRLRKPLERRIYELCRKHCGDQPQWKIRLELLREKIGTTAPIRKLRFQLRELLKTDHLPDYSLSMADDVVTVRRLRAACIAQPMFFNPETFQKAKLAAPGLDVYALEDEFRDWIAGKKNPPLNPAAAFVGFCRRKARQAMAG